MNEYIDLVTCNRTYGEKLYQVASNNFSVKKNDVVLIEDYDDVTCMGEYYNDFSILGIDVVEENKLVHVSDIAFPISRLVYILEPKI